MGSDRGDLVELEIPARPEYLALARLLVTGTVSSVPLFAEDRLDDLRLAVSEACTNAIEAEARAVEERGDQAGGDVIETVLIRCYISDDRVEVEVHDHGKGFDPGRLSEHPPVTDPNRLNYERGLGIPLIHILSDEVEFKPSPNGTMVRMVINALSQEPAVD